MRAKSGLVLLACLAAVVAVALLLSGGGFGGGGAADVEGRPDPAAGSATVLEGGGSVGLTAADGTSRHTARGDGTAPGDDTGPKAPTFPASEGIAGRVVDGKRQAISGATVTLMPYPLGEWAGMPDQDAVAETKTTKDGGFLVGPAPEGRVKVRAIAPGFAPSVAAVSRRGARVELVLDVGGALNVCIVDAKAQPVADATVLHQSGTWQTAVMSLAVTGKDGWARFAAVPTGSSQLLVTKPGLGALRQADVGVSPGAATEITLVLQGGRELTGTVTNADDNRPIAGAVIEVYYPNVWGVKPTAPVKTVEDGRFRTTIDVGPGEQFELRARHPDYAEVRQYLNFNDSGSGSMQQDLKLGKGTGGISGRVFLREGGGAARATVAYGGGQPGQTLPSTTTDSDGRFDLPAPAWGSPGSGWYVIASTANDGLGAVHAMLPNKNEARGKPVEIRLSGSGAIEGVVKDGAGQPVQGAAISTQIDWNGMQRGGRDGRVVDWNIVNAIQDPKVNARFSAVTDDAGHFAIPGLPIAVFQVTAQWGGLQATHEEPVEVSAGSTARVELTLGEGSTIEGLVLDGEERPVPGATIWAQATEQRQGRSVPWVTARTQSDGRFSLRGVGQGAYTVNAYAANYTSDAARNVSAGTTDVLLHVKGLGWIDGEVVSGGAPFAGAFTVSATRKAGRGGSEVSEGNMRNWREDGGGRSQLFSTADGRFTLRGLTAGEYAVMVSTSDGLVTVEPGAATVVDGRGAGPVTISLLTGSVVTGEVEGVDGRPLAGCWLWFYPPRQEDGRAGPTGSARADDKGAFTVRGLGSGAYTVGISTNMGVNWTESFELQIGEQKRMHLAERAPGRVRITVVDASGAGLEKATPSLTDAGGNMVQPNIQLLRRDGILDGRARDSWERASMTDATGSLLRYHVPPGRYRVSAYFEGYTPPTDPPWIDVASNAVTDITVTMTRAAGK